MAQKKVTPKDPQQAQAETSDKTPAETGRKTQSFRWNGRKTGRKTSAARGNW